MTEAELPNPKTFTTVSVQKVDEENIKINVVQRGCDFHCRTKFVIPELDIGPIVVGLIWEAVRQFRQEADRQMGVKNADVAQ